MNSVQLQAAKTLLTARIPKNFTISYTSIPQGFRFVYFIRIYNEFGSVAHTFFFFFLFILNIVCFAVINPIISKPRLESRFKLEAM